jgi:hypothetical protein
VLAAAAEVSAAVVAQVLPDRDAGTLYRPTTIEFACRTLNPAGIGGPRTLSKSAVEQPNHANSEEFPIHLRALGTH